MAQRSNVPKFGNWESEENVPYTTYFDNARKSKIRGKDDHKDNPEMISNNTPHVQASEKSELKPEARKGPEVVRPKHEHHTSREVADQRHGGVGSRSNKAESEALKGPEALKSKHERRLSREDGDLRRSTDSPLQHETVGQRVSSDSPLHFHGGLSSSDIPRRATRLSTGSDHSIEHSPLHPHYQARIGGKSSGVSSPSWERKGSSQGSSHGLAPLTPGRSRLRSVTRGDETPDHGAAVPKFGEWDESNPASADGYTHIFNKVREEKQIEAGKVPAGASATPYSNGHKQYGNENSKSCCCFPWSRK